MRTRETFRDEDGVMWTHVYDEDGYQVMSYQPRDRHIYEPAVFDTPGPRYTP
jgi:hypothetical protein